VGCKAVSVYVSLKFPLGGVGMAAAHLFGIQVVHLVLHFKL
jgi:hypothetical protein